MSGATGDVQQPSTDGSTMVKAAEYTFPRKKATIYGVAVGILIGLGNTLLLIVFPSWLELIGWLVAALLTVLLLHEGLHGGLAKLLGYNPIFGVEPPLVFTTFNEKIERNHLMAIALAPLVALNAVFVSLYSIGVLELFSDLCFAVNTIGSIGDVWIVTKVIRHPASALIQDTKKGVEVWEMEPF